MPDRVAHPDCLSRLPLQVGTSCLWAIAGAAVTAFPGAVSIAIGVASWLDPQAEGGTTSFVVGLALLAYGVSSARAAWRTRPSDAILGEEALRIEGGVRDGLRIGFSELDPERTGKPKADDGAALQRLRLVTTAGKAIEIAQADDPGEQLSLDALCDSIAAKLHREPPPAPQLPAEVIGCPGCGAPVPPDDADSVACAFCSRSVPMPETLRERTRAARRVRQGEREIDATVTSLLQQPNASWAAGSLLGVTAIAGGVWVPVTGGLLAVGLTSAGGYEVGWSFVTGALTALVALVLGRAALASRRALRLLASSFGARAPEGPDGVPGCRRCGAPLPPSEGIIVGCVFCGADNVLGIDVRHHVRATEEHALSLREVVASRDTERRRWRRRALGIAPVALLAGLMTAMWAATGIEFRDNERKCEGGDAEACYLIYIDYGQGVSVAEDDARAMPFGERACELGQAQACFDLGQALYYGWDVEEDEEHAETLRLRACELGHEPACSPYE